MRLFALNLWTCVKDGVALFNGILEFIATIVTIIRSVINKQDIINAGICVVVVIFTIILVKVIIMCFLHGHRYNKRLLKGIDIAKNLCIWDAQAKDKGLAMTLLKISDAVKEWTSEMANCECSVSIKMLEQPANVNNGDYRKLTVRNICRDRQSAISRSSHKYNESVHKIEDNTAYINTINKLKKSSQTIYYANKCVDVRNGEYQTSSLAAYNYKLPYKSEIVFPIVQPFHESEDNITIFGFLCVDSESSLDFKKIDGCVNFLSIASFHLYNIFQKTTDSI